MIRALVFSLAVVLLTLLMPDARAALSPPERLKQARYRTVQYPRDEFSEAELRRTVHAAAVRLGASESCMVAIVNRESGWNEKARNSYSGAAGLFQHLPRYWDGRVRAYRYAMRNRPALQIKPTVWPYNGRANILVSARLIAIGQTFHWGGC